MIVNLVSLFVVRVYGEIKYPVTGDEVKEMIVHDLGEILVI